MDQKPNPSPKLEAPRGRYPGRMDDRGRVKLAAPFKEYLEQFEEKKLFVTSLDRRIAQIYPIHAWRETERFLENFTDDPIAAENLAFNAADLGAETEMDAQGRVLFSPELRRELGLEDQQLHLYAFGGRIEVLNEPLYEERKRAAMVSPAADRAKLRQAGM